MTLVLPDEIIIRVESEGRSDGSVVDLLITVDFELDGRYYFGSLVGLTDALGVAQTTRQALATHFRDNQAMFPKHYWVPLEECDGMVLFAVPGGAHFQSQATAATSAPMISPTARALWARARNGQVATVSHTLDLTSHLGSVTVTLRTRPAS